jgi:transcription elongation factor GreA
MTEDTTQYISAEKLQALKDEFKQLRDVRVPEIAKRIDDARQMGDLSENAEYHAAREEMSWTQSRIKELEFILQNAQIIKSGGDAGSKNITIGAVIVVEVNGKKREYTIVGGQEADPTLGKISNESPLGLAFLGKKKGDKVSVTVPAGVQTYEILEIK